MNDLILGHTWEEIRGMQQKKWIDKTIDCSKPSPIYGNLPCGTQDSDLQILSEIGVEGLKKEGMYGILDRLTRFGVIVWDGRTWQGKL